MPNHICGTKFDFVLSLTVTSPSETAKQQTDLEFRVVNNENREIYAAQMGSTIRLDALLLDSSGKF